MGGETGCFVKESAALRGNLFPRCSHALSDLLGCFCVAPMQALLQGLSAGWSHKHKDGLQLALPDLQRRIQYFDNARPLCLLAGNHSEASPSGSSSDSVLSEDCTLRSQDIAK